MIVTSARSRALVKLSFAFLVGLVQCSLATCRETPVGIRDVIQRRIDKLELDIETSMPLCGVYAVSRAFGLSGKSLNINQYVTKSFVPTVNGSSPADLMKIVNLESGSAYAMSNLSCWEIGQIDLPLIANVRSSRSARSYDHWVCVISHDGELKLFDGHRPAVDVDRAEFMAMWNGYGVFVDPNRRYSSTTFWLKIWSLRLAYLVFLIVPIGAALWVIGRTGSCTVSRKIAVVGGLSLAATFIVLYCQMSFATWSRGMAMSGVMEKRIADNRISLDELEAVSKNPEALLVDCRFPSAFEMGTIPGAVGVSVKTGEFNLRELFRDVDPETRIVVFCQSAKCAYSDVMATRLEDMGFNHVDVSKNGIREFRQMMIARRSLPVNEGQQ